LWKEIFETIYLTFKKPECIKVTKIYKGKNLGQTLNF